MCEAPGEFVTVYFFNFEKGSLVKIISIPFYFKKNNNQTVECQTVSAVLLRHV